MTYKINIDLQNDIIKEKLKKYLDKVNYELQNKIKTDEYSLFFYENINKIELTKEEYNLKIIDKISKMDEDKKNILISKEEDYYKISFYENICFLDIDCITKYNLRNAFNEVFECSTLERIYKKTKNT